MPRVIPAALLFAAVACTPTFNWRDVAVEPIALRSAFPCKPEKAERTIPFSRGRDVLVHALGCEAGGVAYALLWVQMASAAEAGEAMSQWKQASLASLHGRVESEQRFVPRGALDLPESVLVRSAGQRDGAGALQSQAAYFGRGAVVIQAGVHGPALKAETVEPFFAGLRFE